MGFYTEQGYKYLTSAEKFILNRMLSNYNFAVNHDWEEERLFAEFLGDKEAEELFAELIQSSGISSLQIGVYKFHPATKRLTRKRGRTIKGLDPVWITSSWSGVGYQGCGVTNAKRYKTYWLTAEAIEFLKDLKEKVDG